MLQCTPEGIRLQCYMKYYTEEMKTSWFHKYSRFALIREFYKCTLIPAVNRVQFNWVHRANIIPDHNISHGCRWPCFRIVVLSLVFRVFRESKIASSERMRIGGTSEMAWMQICEPTDREKGQYTIEIHDGKTAHTRSFDLSGQGKSCIVNWMT